MRYRLTAILIMAALSLWACQSIFGPPPKPTRTPRPTITPTRTTLPATSTPIFTAPPEVATLTATPSGTVTADAVAPTATSVISPTPTVKVNISGQPLAITNVLLMQVERDPATGNALASIQVVYSGGRAPYIIYHDDIRQTSNPFKVPATCNGTLVHTIRLTSGDGQSLTKKYFISPITCPP
jgi:hypothetical protein